MTAPINSRSNPYVGPRPFRPGERIYGRDREIDGLLNVLIAERVVLLYSPSGAGKSSLVQAGLLPYLENDGGFGLLPIARVNLEPDPTLALLPGFNRYVYSVLCAWEEAKPEPERLPPPVLAGLTLSDYLTTHIHLEQPAIVLLFDQFEEILTVDPMNKDAKTEFFEQVGRALRDKSRWALFSMREDFIAGLDPYLRPIPTRLSNRFRLDLLALEAALQAVQLPAQDAGVVFQEAAAKRLVDDLRRIRVQKPTGESEEQLGPYVEPVQLQVVCRRLWDGLQPTDTNIDHADIEAAGDADQALSEYYADRVRQVAEDTGVSERAIRTWCDQQLITETGIRGQVLLGPEKSQGLDNRAVRALERVHLVRSEKRGGAIWFELAHDRLIKPVRQNNNTWFQINLSDFQRAAEMWHRTSRPDYLLLSGQFLFQGMKWATAHMAELNEVEKDFWAACAKAEARAKRDRIVRWALVGLGVFVAVLAVLAGLLYTQAEEQRRLAVGRERAGAALNVLNSDPELSVLLALQAAAQAPEISEVQDALHRALEAQRIELRLEHPGRVYAARFTYDNQGILTAGDDGVVRRWNDDGTLDWETDPAEAHTGPIYSLVVYPDDTYFATASADGTVKLWLVDTGQLEATLFNGPDRVWWLAFDPDQARLGVASADDNAYILDAYSGELILTLVGHTEDVSAIAFGPYIATGSYDNTIRFWTHSGEPLQFLWSLPRPGMADPLSGISGVQAIQVGEEQVRTTTALYHNEDVQGIQFDPSLNLFYSVGSDRTFRTWVHFPADEEFFGLKNALSIELSDVNTSHTDWVYNLTFNTDFDDRRNLATFSEDRTIHIWDMTGASPREVLVLYGHKGAVFSGDFSADGRYLVSASRDGIVLLWSLGPSRELYTLDLGERVYAAAFNKDGARFATGQRTVGGPFASVFDTETGDVLFHLLGHTEAVEALEYAPDGRFILTGSRDGTARIWQAADGAPVLTVTHPEFACLPPNVQPCYIYGVAWSPDGTRFATVGRDGRVVVWESATGNPLLALSAGLGSVADVAFSPDGRWLASGHAAGQAVLWDTASGQQVATLDAESDIVEAVAFSPDTRRLVTASAGGALLVWDLTNAPAQVAIEDELFGHVGGVYRAAYSPDGRYILSGSTDKQIKLWDAATLETRLTLTGHTDRVYAVDMNPAGTRLISGGADGTLRLYTLDMTELMALARDRLTRWLTSDECRKYLQTPVCPAP